MSRITVSEKTFLKDFALRQFNNQRGLKGSNAIRQEDCDIFSITPTSGFRYGYEVFTRRLNDSFRIRIYFNVGRQDTLSRFELLLAPPFMAGVLGDEVWVATGVFDTAYTYYQGYKLEWIYIDPTLIPIVLLGDNTPLLLTDGGFLILT